MPQGTRLTLERIGLLKIGKELQAAEREILLEILYTQESILTFK